MPVLPLLTTVYATDEHVAIRAPGDYSVLCPRFQSLAYGVDGVFQSGTRWTLESVSVNFEANGVQPGNVALLTKPISMYRGSGDLLAIDSVNGSSLSLRRLGCQPGIGFPPGAVGGTTAVEFLVATLAPQIEDASFDINQTYNIDPDLPGRQPADVKDLRELRAACVLRVLVNRYADANREAAGDFTDKLRFYGKELTEVLGRLSIRWKADINGISQTTTRFSTRLVR